ncbi:hypothetical protein JXB31_04245 [Candidatus Woesearchaeota archaeon]|nr:hypothetical protein [Candidatus Woesearchaeota archaeon]
MVIMVMPITGLTTGQAMVLTTGLIMGSAGSVSPVKRFLKLKRFSRELFDSVSCSGR